MFGEVAFNGITTKLLLLQINLGEVAKLVLLPNTRSPAKNINIFLGEVA